MNRRRFLGVGAAGSATAMMGGMAQAAQAPGAHGSAAREFYLLRRYQFASGPQLSMAEQYFGKALIPAINRMGMTQVGAMKLDVGTETPAYYLLVPGGSVETLATLDLRLADDAEFMKAGEPFWAAPAKQPAFVRLESSLLSAFPGWPKLTPPKAGTGAKRIFQMRTYESPSHAAHVRKMEMFHRGEFEIFRKAGCEAVFYADQLVGSRLPCLTYMLTFANEAELNAGWEKFRTDPEWQKLSHSERYAYEAIVSNISNQFLSPLACSQI